MTPALQAKSREASQVSEESGGDQPRQQAASPPKVMSKGRLDVHPRLDEAAGPSHGGWHPVPPPMPLAGHKRAVVSSQSPKKTDAKVA